MGRLAVGRLEDTIELMDGTPRSQGPQSAPKTPQRKSSGCLLAVVIAFGFFIVLGVCLGPTGGPGRAYQSSLVQTAHALGIALYSYANDNQGLYPDGTSSTEVFQKLMDGGYVTDPAIFYIAMDG